MWGLSPTRGLGVACHRLRSFSRVCCRRCAGHSPSLLKCDVCRSFVRLGVFCRASASGAVGRRWDSGGCRESFCDARGVEFEAATVFDFGVAAYGAGGRCRCVALVSGNLSRGRECRWLVRGYPRRQGQRSRSQPLAPESGNLSRGRECGWQVRAYTRRQGQGSGSQPLAPESGNLSWGRECRWQVSAYNRRQGQRSRSQPPQTDIQTDIHLSIQTDGQTDIQTAI